MPLLIHINTMEDIIQVVTPAITEEDITLDTLANKVAMIHPSIRMIITKTYKI